VIGLYSILVPALVQQIEPLTSLDRKGLVYWTEGDLVGYLDVHRGPKAIWVQPYFHPSVDIADELIGGFVSVLMRGKAAPLYVCVRSYQGGMSGGLEKLGFVPSDDQAVMVKRLAVPLQMQAKHRTASLEGTQPEPTAPFAHVQEPVRPYTPERGR
jgi:hypothetical protein